MLRFLQSVGAYILRVLGPLRDVPLVYGMPALIGLSFVLLFTLYSCCCLLCMDDEVDPRSIPKSGKVRIYFSDEEEFRDLAHRRKALYCELRNHDIALRRGANVAVRDADWEEKFQFVVRSRERVVKSLDAVKKRMAVVRERLQATGIVTDAPPPPEPAVSILSSSVTHADTVSETKVEDVTNVDDTKTHQNEAQASNSKETSGGDASANVKLESTDRSSGDSDEPPTLRHRGTSDESEVDFQQEISPTHVSGKLQWDTGSSAGVDAVKKQD